MKSIKRSVFAGVLAGAVLAGITAFGREGIEQLTAVYSDIKIIVDRTTIDPRDVNGNSVEPFIANGTTYLPVRAVANAFNKSVAWDDANSTVYLGEQVSKPKKEVTLHDRSYLECSDTTRIKQGISNGVGYIQAEASNNIQTIANDPDPRYLKDNYITFSTNGIAKTISGDFYVKSNANDYTEGVLKIYDQNGTELYCSPIMRNTTEAEHFEVDVTNTISVKLMFEKTSTSYYNSDVFMISNPTLVTSDY